MSDAWEDCIGLTPIGASILELGTLRWGPNPTHHRAVFPNAGRYVMADIAPGVDVDVIADAHDLEHSDLWIHRFDLVQAHSVFEHLERPWIAMQSIASILKPDGLVYICTHQTFPLHGYPQDFWRFSTKALAIICKDAGLEVVSSGYEYPCKIIPPDTITGPLSPWNDAAPAYLNVQILARAT